jgi:cytochrome d ubiquinol oxidase subunit II
VLVPFAMGTVLGGIASGRVPVGNAEADPFSSWLNPTSIFLGVLAVASGAYISAVFLAGDAKKLELPDIEDAFRRRALGAGIVSGVLAIGGIAVLHSDAKYVYDGLTSGMGLVCVIGSAIAGTITLYLLWSRRFELARFSAAAAVTAVVAGWGFAQSPYLLPTTLTQSQAVASNATLQALLLSVAVGLVVLVPSLFYLYRLALRGDLQEEFRPLDEKFGADE